MVVAHRHRSWIAVFAAGLLLVASTGCGGDEAPVAAPPVDTTGSTPSTAPVARVVPRPEAGALRVHVAGADDSDERAEPSSVLLFGDSVAGLVADDLAAVIASDLHVDAVDCRRLDLAFAGPCGGVPSGTDVPAGLDTLRATVDELVAAGDAPEAAVMIVANNAAIRAADLQASMEVLGPIDTVWWVTTNVEGRGWRDPNNALLAELAADDTRVGVVDWFEASTGESWLEDHVHPDELGQRALAELVADRLRCDCPDGTDRGEDGP